MSFAFQPTTTPLVFISYLMYMLSHPLKPIEDWIFRILYFFSRIKHYSFQRFNVLSIILTITHQGVFAKSIKL